MKCLRRVRDKIFDHDCRWTKSCEKTQIAENDFFYLKIQVIGKLNAVRWLIISSHHALTSLLNLSHTPKPRRVRDNFGNRSSSERSFLAFDKKFGMIQQIQPKSLVMTDYGQVMAQIMAQK